MSRTALILGSNCESVISHIKVEQRIPFDQIDRFPESEQNVPGHALEVLMGTMEGSQILCYNGRFHLYQGLSAFEISAPVRHAYHAGCDTLVITTGAASLVSELEPGDLMVVTDHVNLTSQSPLIGPTVLFPDDVPFVDMYAAYDEELIEIAMQVAQENDLSVMCGLQACKVGPEYLTPAETRMLASLGCSTISLSMVAEVIQARALGMRVLGISNINSRAGLPSKRRPVDEMLVKSSEGLDKLISGVLARI